MGKNGARFKDYGFDDGLITEYFIYLLLFILPMHRRKLGRKAQVSAAGTAVLLAVIAGLIVLFVLFLQPEERARVLGEPVPARTSTGETSGGTPDELEDARLEKNLLREQPGKIDFLNEDEIEHSLPVITIYTTTETEILAERSNAHARRGAFTEEEGRLTFRVSDVSRTQDIYLGFAVKEAEGQLQIQFNGEEIYQAEITSGSVRPIKLPNELLQEDNELIFGVSSPGIAFWRVNDIQLENVRVAADITDVEARNSRHLFLLSETERRNLERMRLKFQPACEFREVGPLQIQVNGNIIYDAVPECDNAFIPLEFSPGMVQDGENEIIFRTEKGTYVLSHVVVVSELKEVDFPTYYFDLSEDEYRSVLQDGKRVRLQFEFVDVRTSKFGDIVLNGHLRHFDTRDTSMTLDVSDDVVKGSNSLKIKPRKTVEIREMRVDVVE